MATEPDILDLNILCPPPGEGYLEVRPVVSGRDLLAELTLRSQESGGPRFVGSGPRYLLGRGGPLHATAVPQEVRLAVSGCGLEQCCSALYVTVSRDGEHVVWASWRDPAGRGFDLPEFRFAVDQYEAEVLRAEADRGWEWPGAVVATLLEEGLRGREDWLARWECELEAVWASRLEPDRIDVILRHPPGREETDLPWAQFLTTLPISADDPSEQAERLEARLTAGDPRATAELCGGYDPEQVGYPWP
ncbi:hypothetical protein ACFU6K_32665 [Kitasatospora sp. NPDC057512]|uniref:hypothetical protein n=1 Tax=Kitasatospora sp. NPDC057512 TaxID=3346154 RepID=UPI00367E658A